ncbi:hypothetical protein AVEN_262230-1 [Araneus ventricosus]|uniref:Uncharacterized protein n=1 Tax=Araneus ventricosus TaxID=182803 RepID=A0A4Y2PNS1_ARAVE|nr:hypothetical protein AVEN_262230-1 [Araneus ventricosus]
MTTELLRATISSNKWLESWRHGALLGLADVSLASDRSGPGSASPSQISRRNQSIEECRRRPYLERKIGECSHRRIMQKPIQVKGEEHFIFKKSC